ncbi:L,D-transpeptidase [Paenibacillus sp. NPDC056579]|uniref:L,D-transpeptidase n=1 Tax=unclassified Paenibacillus TaxID=185978 RepID=UPI001EF80DFC|nr:L,D-transpeptidase [Paenibacillus sp. H1-7]
MKRVSFAVLLAICVLFSGFGPLFTVLAAPDNPPIEALQEEGVYIVINKRSNSLIVYVNGRAQYYFPVATGRRKDLTPVGEFQIVTKIVKPFYVRKQIAGGHPKNPLGSRWLGLSVPGTGGYTYGIHGTNRPYSIGSHASSGCVRMHNKDIEWLHRHIPIGTKVIIREN